MASGVRPFSKLEDSACEVGKTPPLPWIPSKGFGRAVKGKLWKEKVLSVSTMIVVTPFEFLVKIFTANVCCYWTWSFSMADSRMRRGRFDPRWRLPIRTLALARDQPVQGLIVCVDFQIPAGIRVIIGNRFPNPRLS